MKLGRSVTTMADLRKIDYIEHDDEEELISDQEQLVTFKLDNEEYGVDIMQVQEIIRLGHIVRIPGAPPFVEGIMDLRGKVLPVVDLRRRFNLGSREHGTASRVVVVNIADMTLGLVVDAITEVLRLPKTAIEPPPRIVAGIDARFLKGIGRVDKRLLILLDLDRIFAEEELREVGQIAQVAGEG